MDLVLGRRKRRLRGPLLVLLVLAGLAGAGFGIYSAVRVGAPPEIELKLGLPGIGRATPVEISVREPKRGLSNVEVELVQGDQRYALLGKTYTPQPSWAPWQDKKTEDRFQLVVGKDAQPSLKEGPAQLAVSARPAGTWLRSPPPVVVTKEVPVRLRPPTLEVLSTHIYPTQGGSEAVVYRVGETASRSGVQSGEHFFPGHPLPGGDPRDRFALFGVPFDLSDPSRIRLVVEDEVQNRQAIPFIDRLTPKPPPHDTIRLRDDSMARIVRKLRARHPELADTGTLLGNYIQINRDMRRDNNAKIDAVGKNTQAEFMWSKSFVQMKGKVVSNFADRRSYVYEGEVVDKADHLGFDLASVAHGPIPAANNGVVVFAGELGIYGDALIVDHGYGLMTIYAHCSKLLVKVGDAVTRGQTIARTGTTGMAFGDHLHFSTLLYGMPVNPIEWWDGQWIQNRVAAKLPGVLKLSAEDPT